MRQDREHIEAWLALHLTPGCGGVTCQKLVAHFGSPQLVLSANQTQLKEVAGWLRKESAEALYGAGKKEIVRAARQELDRADELGVDIISIDEPCYPALLKNIHDPPPVLYVQGNPAMLDCRGIAMVGSRAASSYGRSVAVQLAGGLAKQGYTIISGLALGIDTESHKGALAAGGRTIAVLGCGLDVVYPPSNHLLYKEIAESGAVVSEYPLGTPPDNFRFPARNRIISGLSFGVVVVEATKRSGSLITANHALEQGREIFAVPGRIDSMKSSGSHALLQEGAKLVFNINDIIDELAPDITVKASENTLLNGTDGLPREPLSPEEEKIYSFLDVYPCSIDEIVRQCGLTPQKANELLLMLELKGVVESLPGKSYQKNSTLAS
jgi:DNA processing protein